MTKPFVETITVMRDDSPVDISDYGLGARSWVGYSELNPGGVTFGGWLLAQADLGAHFHVARTIKKPIVTRAVEGFNFIKKSELGDCISVYAKIIYTGRSSIKTHVLMSSMSYPYLHANVICDGVFVFVAIDPLSGKPVQI